MTEPQAKPPRLGAILDKPEPRDAIHIAVVAVVCDASSLSPGDDVHVMLHDGEYVAVHPIPEQPAVGIVDPFLKCRVMKGDRFWLFVYPNTITTLRHQWTHPAFAPETPSAPDLTTAQQREAAQKYLCAFASEWSMDYQEMIDGAISGAGITARGQDAHWSDVEDGGDEFWRSLEIVTGKRFDRDHRENTYFSCSC
jgi:hypothetical protein